MPQPQQLFTTHPTLAPQQLAPLLLEGAVTGGSAGTGSAWSAWSADHSA